MKHRRIPGRRAAVVAGTGIAALVVAGVTLQTANASEASKTPVTKTLSVAAAGKLASALGKDLGTAAAGTYYDAKAQNLVVNVLDETEVRFHCECSQEKDATMIAALGRDEVVAMIEEDNGAVMTCGFCSETYSLSSQELREILETL